MIKILHNFQNYIFQRTLQVVKSVKNHLLINQKIGAKCLQKNILNSENRLTIESNSISIILSSSSFNY